jgi:Flp pilus assembly protein TadB
VAGTLLLLALIGAAGAFLVADGFVGLIPTPRHKSAGLEGAARARMQGMERERVTLLEEAPLLDRLLRPALEDLVGRVGRRQRDDVEARLRRSGWKYRTVGDFYATRVLLAGMFFSGGAAFLAVSGATFLFWAPLALGALGYFIPEQELRAALKERNEQVLTEMAFTLDRLALLLRAGMALQEALGPLAEAPGGAFVAALRRLARRIGAGGTGAIDEALETFEADLPQEPEVQQFVGRLRVGLAGTAIADSLQIQADRLRAALNARLLKRGLQTVLVITTVGAAFMLPALGILILGPPLLLAFSVL